MQTSYNLNPSASFAGLLGDTGEVDIVTRTGTEKVLYGNIVMKATGDDNVKLPDAAADATHRLEGILVYSQDVQSGLSGDGATPGLDAGTPLNILRKGRIWVYCETAFNPDSDTLFVRFTDNGAGKTKGQVRNDADSGKADELGASGYGIAFKPLNTLTAAGYLLLDVNFPSTVN